MARIRGHGNTATELKLIALFRANKITGWRRKANIFGSPDFVFPKDRVAVFVDGEFWHGHPILCAIPKTNSEFWQRKISKNKARDRLVNATLRKRGWIVVRIWQHQLKSTVWLFRIKKAFKAARRRGVRSGGRLRLD